MIAGPGQNHGFDTSARRGGEEINQLFDGVYIQRVAFGRTIECNHPHPIVMGLKVEVLETGDVDFDGHDTVLIGEKGTGNRSGGTAQV